MLRQPLGSEEIEGSRADRGPRDTVQTVRGEAARQHNQVRFMVGKGENDTWGPALLN